MRTQVETAGGKRTKAIVLNYVLSCGSDMKTYVLIKIIRLLIIV